MIVEKGRILVITDPCTFAKDEDWGEKFDFENLVINAPEFSDYIWVPTGFGDGDGDVFESDKPKSQYELEEIIQSAGVSELSLSRGFNHIGKFCVDSGSFGVFFLDEVLKYNPNYTLDVGSWCYTVIKDFEGAVYDTSLCDNEDDTEENINNHCSNYIIGSGTKSFYTVW